MQAKKRSKSWKTYVQSSQQALRCTLICRYGDLELIRDDIDSKGIGDDGILQLLVRTLEDGLHLKS